jgi:hypothetical protein
MLRTYAVIFWAACSCTLLSACNRSLSSAEQKVVGTWDRTGLDTTERTTFRSDHTMESEMTDGSGTLPFASGTWYLEGNILVTEYEVKMTPPPGETPFPKQIIRDPILEFQPDKLIREKGRPPLIRVR